MIFVFRKTDGQVVEATPTNSWFPDGVPNVEDVINNVINSFGGKTEDYGYIRVHDIKDAEIVNKTATHEYIVQSGEIVFGDERPIPEPEPQSPSEIELLRQENQKLKEEDLNNKEAIAELYLLMSGGF